jgi:RNA polymerase sigma-70 factor (ECF subfamily)
MSQDGREDTHRTVERVARESFGRLIAYVSTHTRDVASAEDALGDALVAALTTWPRTGIPRTPEAWLVTTARRALIDRARHQQVVLTHEATLQLLTQNHAQEAESSVFPDERLKLLFVCAHPAIDPGLHTPLMLQTVLGLDAARIARVFLISPKTMGQRLVRAKTKIRHGGIPFEIPEPRELPRRLNAVLEAIYAAFGIGWDDMAGPIGIDQSGQGLADESIWLARVLIQLMPAEPEALGLLALMLHCEARRSSRRGPDGGYIPLSTQDPREWSRPLMEEAERLLTQAWAFGRTGRFQLEAAIQSVHAQRAWTGRTEWEAIAAFYEQLVRVSPTAGTLIGWAAAAAEAKGPDAGLHVLDSIDRKSVTTYQPFWAVRAHLLQRLGRPQEAAEAFDQAIGLAEDPAVKRFLLQKRN